MLMGRVEKFLRVRKLERKLEDYVKTLSPEKQAAAHELRKKLINAPDDRARHSILLAEGRKIQEKQMRVIERLEAVRISVDQN